MYQEGIMDDEEFIDENLEVLQNIEATVVHLYHKNPSLTDFDIMQAVRVTSTTLKNFCKR